MGNVGSSIADACSKVGESIMGGGGANSTSTQPSSVTICGTQYKIASQRIGEGGYAFVYQASINGKSGKDVVALKRFVIPDDDAQDSVLAEVSFHQRLSSLPHIVRYETHEVIHVAPRGKKLPEVWVVMEMCQGGSLETEVNRRIQNKSVFSEEEVCCVLSDVVSGIAEMHSLSPPIAHWDIKVGNVLMAKTAKGGMRYKLCDFGSCSSVYYLPATTREVSITELELEKRMTLLYRSPESLDVWSKKEVGLKSDVWSLGVILYTLLFQTMPFEENPRQIMANQFRPINDQKTYPLPPHLQKYPKLEKILFEMLLVQNVEERANIFEVSKALHEIFPVHQQQCLPLGENCVKQKNRFTTK